LQQFLYQCFSFKDVRTSEIKLQLNNAAGGRLYFTRPLVRTSLKLKQNTETTWNSFSVHTSWKWNKTKLLTVGWNKTADRRQFCFISVYFTMCARH